MLLYVIPLGVRPVIIPDEVRYAEIPREMIASGNWAVPRLNGLRYFEKPVMGYWLNALSMILFGENAFAMRFPSAMAVGLSALMIFLMLRKFSNVSLSGIFAAAIFITCPLVYGIGTFSVLDSLLSLFVTGSMVTFFWSYMAQDNSKKLVFQFLCGIFCGLAFLTKGFLAFVVPLLAILPFLLWERRLKDVLSLSWLIIITAVIVSVPWAVIVHLSEPDFWHYFFWIEHVKRFMADNAQHAAPFWYFVPVLAGGALPWIIFSPAVIPEIKVRLKYPLIRFALCWFVFPFLFFSVSSGKVGTSLLPCFPPLAMLISIGLLKYMEGEKRRVFTRGVYFMVGLMATLALALLIIQVTDFIGIKAYAAGETWKWIIGAAGLAVWALLLIGASKTADFKKQLALYCAAPVLFMLCGHFILPDQVKERKSPAELLLRYADQILPETVLVTNDLARAVCWFYKRDDVYLLDKKGELKYGLSYADAGQRLLNIDQFKKMIAERGGQKEVFFITETKRYARYKESLPKPLAEDIWGQFVIARF